MMGINSLMLSYGIKIRAVRGKTGVMILRDLGGKSLQQLLSILKGEQPDGSERDPNLELLKESEHRRNRFSNPANVLAVFFKGPPVSNPPKKFEIKGDNERSVIEGSGHELPSAP
jgi:hypothetical protein